MANIRTGEENAGHIDGDYSDRGVVGPAGQRSLMLWRALSAVLLLTMGGIHLYLVLTGFGGLLGVLFVLNAIGGVVLAIAMIAAPRRFLPLASVLSLLFMAGTLLALVLALTVGQGAAWSDPRVFLAGYGPQASTIGANRAGRMIARQIMAMI